MGTTKQTVKLIDSKGRIIRILKDRTAAEIQAVVRCLAASFGIGAVRIIKE
jgi:antitoxin component HigA of HigAB toxin-antitoxin module